MFDDWIHGPEHGLKKLFIDDFIANVRLKFELVLQLTIIL